MAFPLLSQIMKILQAISLLWIQNLLYYSSADADARV